MYYSELFFCIRCIYIYAAAAAAAKSRLTLCDPIDGSHQASPSLGARTLEWVAISFNP